MKKYTLYVKRVSINDDPLMPGQMAFCLTESSEGKLFSEIIEELLESTNIQEIQRKNDLLQLRYILNVEISSKVEQDDLDDLRYGLSRLDKSSIDFRQKLAANDQLKIKEGMRRTHANLHIKGLFDVNDFAQEFDTCNADISKMSIKEIEDAIVFIAQIAQRTNPTVFTISTELANKLMDKDFKETVLGKTLNAKITTLKNVFAPVATGETALENPFVRAI